MIRTPNKCEKTSVCDIVPSPIQVISSHFKSHFFGHFYRKNKCIAKSTIVFKVVSCYGCLGDKWSERKYSWGKQYSEDTSAMFVARTIFHLVIGTKTVYCSLLNKLACIGKILASDAEGELWRELMHCLISWTPGRKMRIPPFSSAVLMMWLIVAIISCSQWMRQDMWTFKQKLTM